ncbi:MAG: VOC family protein [Betaproteobacteria bacterium]|nr:VOC family protein [Betaproteobacteria bacterium]
MAKLRHIAMVVEKMEETARFYEKAFGMKRVRQHETAIGLSDGVVSLVIIHPSNVNMKGDDRRGLHHIGFLVDDM